MNGSDDTTDPLEVPKFTDFGWGGEGELDLRVFEQDTYWVDRTGTPHLLDEMDQDYLSNVLGFLFNNARAYHRAYAELKVAEAEVAAVEGRAHAEVIAVLFGGSVAQISTPKWLASTPLYRKIESLLSSTD